MKKGEHEQIREKAPEIEPVVDTPAVRSFGARKDRKKKIRTIFEIIVLVIIGIVLLKNFVVFDRYDPYDSTDKKVVTGKDAGFLAISYFGVDREGTDTLVSTERLGEQLKALHRLGYVTITQKDILDYYNSGKKLPARTGKT